MKTYALLCLALCIVARPAWGQAATANNNPEARRHFQEGLQSAQRGDLRAALRLFESAHAIQPNFSVLYNIGQAHATLGRPVEAVAAFERYLAEGGAQVSTARRDEVNGILTANRERIGLLRIVRMGNDRVWIDGVEVSNEQLQLPIPLAEGSHSLLHATPGCAAGYQAPVVLSGKTVNVEVPSPTECIKPVAQLQIDCEVPDVEVEVNGVAQAKTPLERPLLAPIGDVVVRFRRAGYTEVSRSVRLTRDRLSRVACGQRVVKTLPPSLAARIVVQRSPEDARVFVDGERFTGLPLPAGAHQFVIEREGFQPTRRVAYLKAGKTFTLSATLTKTPEKLARDKASASRRRNLGLVLGGTGVALLGTAGGLFAWNNQRYSDWRDSVSNATGEGNVPLATSVQRIDDLSFALGLVGAALTGAGAWLVFAPE